jgi:uncharacterized protein HemX
MNQNERKRTKTNEKGRKATKSNEKQRKTTKKQRKNNEKKNKEKVGVELVLVSIICTGFLTISQTHTQTHTQTHKNTHKQAKFNLYKGIVEIVNSRLIKLILVFENCDLR